jgi:hypothetical protein
MQNYKNHVKFYPAHHFVFYPVLLVLIILSIYHGTHSDQPLLFVFITVVLVLIGWESFMLRQHYGLGNQNRIIRLEMRLRYYQLTGQRFEPLEQALTFGQIAALRFASDDELPALIQKTLQEKLSPKAIKQAVTDWQADDMRV